VTIYAAGATGNVKPIQYIHGSRTGLSSPRDIAVDATGNMYVVNGDSGIGGGLVTVFAAGATGNAKPIQTISGSNTGLSDPFGIALDPLNGDIYVTNYLSGSTKSSSVTIYSPGSNGNVAPIGTIAGSDTGLFGSGGLALDPSGNIYVPNIGYTWSLTVYATGSTGNVAPMQTISGNKTKLEGGPEQLALDLSLNIYAANYNGGPLGGGSVTVYAAGATGNVAPIQYITGKRTKMSGVTGIAVDGSDNIYVASENGATPYGSTVTVYAAGATGNVKPINTIKGTRTRLAEPQGIAIR